MTQTQAPAALEQNSAFEATAREAGVLNAEGFFTQDDWEFELDTLQDRSQAALRAHLDKGADHETAMFLKGYLMDSRAHFTPFSVD